MPRPKTEEGRLRRLSLLQLLREYVHEHGYAPTMADLIESTGIPRATLRWHLGSLTDQGFLRFGQDGAMRTLSVTRKDEALLE